MVIFSQRQSNSCSAPKARSADVNLPHGRRGGYRAAQRHAKEILSQCCPRPCPPPTPHCLGHLGSSASFTLNSSCLPVSAIPLGTANLGQTPGSQSFGLSSTFLWGRPSSLDVGSSPAALLGLDMVIQQYGFDLAHSLYPLKSCSEAMEDKLHCSSSLFRCLKHLARSNMGPEGPTTRLWSQAGLSSPYHTPPFPKRVEIHQRSTLLNDVSPTIG